MKSPHKPVLAAQVLESLSPKKGDSYLDLTAGYGGHAQIVADLLGPDGELTLVDRDKQATEYLSEKFSADNRAEVINSGFRQASAGLLKQGKKFDCILADLGISSVHIDEADRGFSFDKSALLDMRMDKSQNKTASQVVNEYTSERLTKMFYDYGELPWKKAEKLTSEIIANRPVETTTELAQIVKLVFKSTRKRIEPQIFQAIRLEVNDELAQLKESLPVWLKLLAPGGRLAIVSFHSLEDRIVKHFFVQHSKNRYEAELRLINKKPVTAAKDETVYNPRARSALLRAAVKK